VALRAGWLLLGATVALSRAAGAQALGLDPVHDLPVWLRNWSALGNPADLPRSLSGAGVATSSFFYGPPRVGSFWTAGNPAGLVDGVRDSRSDFAGTWSRQRGDYRRPLDPGATRLVQASAQSWRAFSAKFSMLGRVTFDQERLDPGSRADFTEAYGSSPFMTADTSSSPLRRTRVVLEGASAWRLGRWDVGVTVGYEAQDRITIESPVVRRGRSVTPGLVLGVARKLGKLRLGGYGRVRHTAETIFLSTQQAVARIYDLTGYREVPFFQIPPSAYYRRRTSDVSGFGATLAGGGDRTQWTLYAEGDNQKERLSRQRQNDPAKDLWDESGWSAGGAVQRSLGASWLVTVHGRAVHLSGDGDQALDSAGTIFRAEETSFNLEGEIRLLPKEGSWNGTLTLGFAHEARTRRDSVLQIGTDVSSGTPSVALEVGRPVGGRLFAAVGGAVAFYGPTSALPDPAARGPVYQAYIGPEYALYASRARPTAVSLLLRYRVSKGSELWLSARTERLSSTEPVPISTFVASGNRTATSVMGGVTVH
jgi:hypothetical protein